MWTQIFGFFALDEILLTLLVGIILEWRRRVSTALTLPFVVAALASASMFIAAIMGHLAGWIMEFGANFPPLIHNYLTFAGFASSVARASPWAAAATLAPAARRGRSRAPAPMLPHARICRRLGPCASRRDGQDGLIFDIVALSVWSPPLRRPLSPSTVRPRPFF